ncbi:heptaprenyl diphosphate synthase component 1 [Bacillus sp. 2205SS5-2]|uniref:heptaprenyl diphosphate synthase component 1 n=1 Tax=Bacillus sp. 2205SS5-2 TaxID=3109031 RepID=UPI003005D54E
MSLSTNMQTIKDYIGKQLIHPFLKKYLGTYTIDEEKLKLLMVPFEGEIGEEEMKFISTTMLVEIALTTHDSVSVEEEKTQINRQLTVLAGDYFSGLYYQILANMNNIELIKALASGIKIVNENKILLYQSELLSIEDTYNSLKLVEAGLIQSFYSFFKADDLIGNVSDYLLGKRLEKEKKLFMQNQHSALFYHVKGNLHPDKVANLAQLTQADKEDLIKEINQKIDLIEETTYSQWRNHTVQNPFVKELFSRTKQPKIVTNLYVEEG